MRRGGGVGGGVIMFTHMHEQTVTNAARKSKLSHLTEKSAVFKTEQQRFSSYLHVLHVNPKVNLF